MLDRNEYEKGFYLLTYKTMYVGLVIALIEVMNWFLKVQLTTNYCG